MAEDALSPCVCTEDDAIGPLMPAFVVGPSLRFAQNLTYTKGEAFAYHAMPHWRKNDVFGRSY